MSIEDTVQHCRDLLDVLPREAVARAQQKYPHLRGFGVFPVYAPLEVIHAAGLIPIGLFGTGNQLETSNADSRFQSFICSIAKSTLELFLCGEMEGFAGAVFSSICDVARNLASVAQRNAPDHYIEYLHLPQNMYSAASREYTRAEFERFRANLARHLEKPITDEALTASLKVYNRVRALMNDLYQERRRRPGSITASELAAVGQAGTRMMPEEFGRLLEPLLEEVRRRPVHQRDSVPVVVEGAFCEQPPLGLVEVIESAGCQIKDDDLTIGWRLFKKTVPVNGHPLDALADAYVTASSYTSVRYDRDRPRTDGLLQRMRDAGAQAVLFAPAKFCEPALLDYVLFRRRLEQEDVPHIKLEFEEKMWTFEAARTEMETFAESMLFD